MRVWLELMSGGSSDEEISNGDRDGYQGGGSDGDDDEDNGIGKKHRRTNGCGFGKQVILHPFTKAKNQIRRIRSKKPLLSSSSSTASSSRNVNVSARGKIVIHGDSATATRIGSCKFCFSYPKVLETPNSSPYSTSDPNNPNFTQSMLKTMIEKNDFYSKECNPHIV